MSQQDWATWWAENWQWWTPIVIGAVSPLVSTAVMIWYDQLKTKGLI